MSKNSIDAYGALGKSNVLFFDPDALVLVTDEASPLYDKRVHLPFDEKLVLNIMYQGINQAIVVAKNTETGKTEVVAGRQRVKAAREANRRLRERGMEPINVPAIAKRADDATLTSVMVSENELRTPDTPIGRAEKMLKLQNLNRTEAEIATVFGCSTATVKSTLALLECSAAVRKAVDDGKVSITHAVKLAKMTPAEQRDKVAELVEAAETDKGHAKVKKQRAVMGEDKPKMKSRKVIQALMEEYLKDGEAVRASVLAWVLGVD